jgi:hypothetical protein
VLGKSRLISLSNVCLGPQVRALYPILKVQFRVSVSNGVVVKFLSHSGRAIPPLG